jgi:hypothetical protein
LGTAVGIFGLARLIGATRPQATFTVLIWATFPQIILQSTTTQNDLVVTVFLVSTLYFLYSGFMEQENKSFILSGMAFGLAMGGKATIFVILPGLALAVVVLWSYKGKTGFKRLMLWGISLFVGFGLLGLFNYVQNQIHYGDPFSIPEWTASITLTEPGVTLLTRGVTNLVLYFSKFIDFTGLPDGVFEFLDEVKVSLLEKAFMDSNFSLQLPSIYPVSFFFPSPTIIHQDTSGFGPIAIMLIPVTIVQFWQGIRKRDFIRIGLAVVGVGFYITLSFLLGWSYYRIRYFVLPVSLLSPFLAFIYRPERKWKLPLGFFAFIGIWILATTFLFNFSKPLVGQQAIWGMESDEIRTINNPKMEPVLEMVEEHVPLDAVLATRLGVNHWDYVLFGDHFTREIIQMDPEYPGIDVDFLGSSGANYVLISPRERPFLEAPDGFVWVDEVGSWNLFYFSQDGISDIPADKADRFLGQTDEDNLLSVDESLARKVGVTELYSYDWGIENNGITALKWLGEGLDQGLSGFLWSELDLPIQLEFHVQPGLSREDNLRNIKLVFLRNGVYGPIVEGAVREDFQIIKPEVLTLITHFHQGLNEFRIQAMDQATIPIQPNGDMRPLLVLLTDIYVKPMEDNPVIIKVDDQMSDLPVSEIYLAPWDVEILDNGPLLWLGEGLDQGFKSYIWSNEDTTAKMVLNLSPGPSREDSTRNLNITLSRYGYYEGYEPISKQVRFDDAVRFEMEIVLYEGLNELAISALDQATIDVLPNGDTRPLLVQLNQIEILPWNE